MTRFEHTANSKRTGRRRGPLTRATLGIEHLEPRCMLSVNVTTWHNDLTLQGLNNNETVLTPANVNNNTFGKLFSYSVTGQIYAEPLYVSNLNMGALGTHNVVFVATENNDVYAFDAVNNGAGGGLLWHVNLGPAVSNSLLGPANYNDITPQVGITSTPVIDLTTNTMYVDSFTSPSSGVYQHKIWALDITTGLQKVAPKLVAASIQGNNPADQVGNVITFNAKQQLQRSALTLLNGVVYAAYAGYGDANPYHGWILGFDASNLNLVKVFNDTPNVTSPEDASAGRGGIWQAGAGLASDGTHLYVMTGNGDFDAAAGDFGDSFLELTPDNSTQPTNKNGYGLSVTDYFTPFDENTLSANDTDLGSAGPLLLPDQPGAHAHEMVGAGKGLTMYLVDRDAMGGHNTSNNSNVVQTVSTNRAPGSQAYFNNLIYFHGYNSGTLKAFQISNGTLSAAAVASGAAIYGFPGATPAVSSNGTANGIVWEIENIRDANLIVLHAVLRAYDAAPTSGNLNELYNSGIALGQGVKFTVPTVADGRVYVGTANSLAVFGLLSNPISVPPAPTNLTATISALQGLQLKLNWTDNGNENAFKIERSTNGVNYTPLATLSVNSTSYNDSTVVPGTTYYYRVFATNPVGDSSPAVVGPVGPDFTVTYQLDEGTATFAGDSGSTGLNTGVLVGATKPAWVAGRIGSGALSFSGTGAYNQTNQSAVQVTSNLVNPLGGTSTFTAWVKTTQTGSNNHQQAPAITGVDQLGTTSDINWGTLNAAGQIGIFVGDAGGLYSTAPINDGNWHNVAMTRDSKTGQVQLYVDGVLNGTSTLDTGIKAAQFYLIGALTDRTNAGSFTGANYFNGQLDDLRIYNRVLSASEISQIGSPPPAPMGLAASAMTDSSSMLQLSWTNPSDAGQSIQVQRRIGASGTYQTIATLSGTATQYFDTNLDFNTDYSYRIQASDTAGGSPYSNESNASPYRPEVVGRFAFYNGSKFDFQNSSSNFFDGPSIAADKQPLFPGQTATFQNYTTYSKGLNGIMIDVANFGGSITRADYELRVGNSSDPSTWQPAPEPSLVTEYLGAGVNGATRLELVWDDNAIRNEWVQVTLKANANTGIAADDVFYFGNAVGDTGNSPTDATVDTIDIAAVHNNYTAAASVTNPYDFNHDKVVDATDEQVALKAAGSPPLQLITVPGASGSGSGAAASLAVRTATIATASVASGSAAEIDTAPLLTTTDTNNLPPTAPTAAAAVLFDKKRSADREPTLRRDHDLAHSNREFAVARTAEELLNDFHHELTPPPHKLGRSIDAVDHFFDQHASDSGDLLLQVKSKLSGSALGAVFRYNRTG